MSPSTPIRLVALDLDGTLLNSQSQISPRTRQAIADADRAQGHRAALHRAARLPACRRWWRSCPASGTPSPPTVPLSGIWAADPLGAVYSRYADAAQRPTQ